MYLAGKRKAFPALCFSVFVRELSKFDDPTDVPEALPLAMRSVVYSEQHQASASGLNPSANVTTSGEIGLVDDLPRSHQSK